MKNSLETTTVKDIAYLVHSACLRAEETASLEKLAGMLCSSDRIKIYLEDAAGRLSGVIQAKQIALKILELSRRKSDQEDLLPAITYILNFHTAKELAEQPVTVNADTRLEEVLELMDRNQVREIALVDEAGRLIGTLEAKHILSHYIQARTEAAL